MEYPRWFLSSILVLCALQFDAVHSQTEGSDCIMDQTGESGVCKKIRQCPAALEGLKRQQLPQTCGFIGSTPIVCCAEPKSGSGSGSATGGQTQDVNERFGQVGAKSRAKCKEYSKHAYTTYLSPVLSATSNPKNFTVLECPFLVVPLIIGGAKAKPKEFPHSAAIGYDNAAGPGRVYHCGGSLISENFVISAGHCISSRIHGFAKYARLGDLNLVSTTDNAQPQEYGIVETIRHPEYRPPSKYNDIVLFRLERNVEFNHYVRPICLYTKDTEPRPRSAIATGWGKTEDADGSDDLLKVTLDFFSHESCYNAFKPNARQYKDGIVDASQVCAGSQTALKDTCNGDSGGPLQIYNTEVECSYWLVGLTSFGKYCGIVRAPAVYTRVSHYIDWIEQTVWP